MLSDFRVYVVHLHHRLEFPRGSPRSVRALWDAAPRHAQAVDWVVTGYEIIWGESKGVSYREDEHLYTYQEICECRGDLARRHFALPSRVSQEVTHRMAPDLEGEVLPVCEEHNPFHAQKLP